MGAESIQNEYRDEEDEDGFKTPKALDKRKKKKKKKQITSETEKHDEDVTMDVRVKQIPEQSDRVPPIVAYFSSAYNPSAKSTESDDRESPSVKVYRHKAETKNKRLEVVVSPPGSSVDFVGSNYTGEAATRQTCVYTLGVLDKETQTLKILPIASNKIFRLEPRVRSKETVDSEAAVSAVVTELTAGERVGKARKLNNLYGTKTAINRDKKMLALNPGDDPEAQKLLDGKLNEVDINAAALESTSSSIARNIPPFDAAAMTPREAYPLDKIIEKEEWDSLQDIYWLLQEQSGATTDAYPVFVRNRIYKLRDIKDETEKQTMSAVLSFLTHLVKFKDMNSMNGFESSKDHRLPGIIRQKCKSLFKDSESTRLPVDKINLLISYVLVLTLHVDQYKTDPEDIAKDLRMSTVDLRKHFENLGCKFAREKSMLLATLPVPLKFPQIMRKRRR